MDRSLYCWRWVNGTGCTLNEVIWRSQRQSKKFILISVGSHWNFWKKKKAMIPCDLCFRDLSLLLFRERAEKGRRMACVCECITHCHGLYHKERDRENSRSSQVKSSELLRDQIWGRRRQIQKWELILKSLTFSSLWDELHCCWIWLWAPFQEVWGSGMTGYLEGGKNHRVCSCLLF